MTPLPKRRFSTRRQGKRRAAIKSSLPILSKCPSCNTNKIYRTVCSNCGK